MKVKKTIRILQLIFLLVVVNSIIIFGININTQAPMTLEYSIKSDHADNYQVYYSKEKLFGEDQSFIQSYTELNNYKIMEFDMPKDTNFFRIDLGTSVGEISVKDIQLIYKNNKQSLKNNILDGDFEKNYIEDITYSNDSISMDITGNDPYLIVNASELISIERIDSQINILFKAIMCSMFSIIIILTFWKRTKIKIVIKEFYDNRYLIWNLSVNDFKTKYAASYLGIFWAFVQPIVTILIYWFVFDVGFKAAPASNQPFILWLIVGIIPWFFYAESIMNATNSLLEYSYLVKKILFKISILPIVKIVSSLFIHLFFITIAIIVYACYGQYPSIYSVQIIYYMLCVVILAAGTSYATASVVVFFRDLGQIVNVILQIGMWLTPIMWNQDMVAEKFHWILKLNPMYYIVQGYRDSFIDRVWFWERMPNTIYFWIVTIMVWVVGIKLFEKLKKHFADVL